MGGIQTPRLLLASNKSSQSISIGNEHEMVGRYLMDHPLIDIGRLRADGSATFNATEFYDLRCINHRSLMGHLAVSRSAMKRYHLLNNSILLYPRPEPTAVQAVQTIQAMRSHKAWQKSWPHLLRSLNEIGRLAIKEYNYIGRSIYLSMKHDQVAVPSLDRGGWSELPEAYDRFNYFRLVMLTEQAPNPSNRIILNHERDPLGIPGVDIYWNTSDLDLESAHQTLALLSQAVDKSGLGFVEPYYRNGSPFFHGHSTHHHMGATRMSWSPREGVVDHNCRVHSCANLFIASSSVFPTGGYANPTFTIIALSLRLADHIKKMIGSDSLWLA
jgi:hypothetical protein